MKTTRVVIIPIEFEVTLDDATEYEDVQLCEAVTKVATWVRAANVKATGDVNPMRIVQDALQCVDFKKDAPNA